ncbi:hypothetical protein GGF44_000991, partial [Coemansia sp. RSA 1694]
MLRPVQDDLLAALEDEESDSASEIGSSGTLLMFGTPVGLLDLLDADDLVDAIGSFVTSTMLGMLLRLDSDRVVELDDVIDGLLEGVDDGLLDDVRVLEVELVRDMGVDDATDGLAGGIAGLLAIVVKSAELMHWFFWHFVPSG